MFNQKWQWLALILTATIVGCFSSPKTLPTNSIDTISPRPEAVGFLTFHHPPMGLTLSYPADWRLETRDSAPTPPPPKEFPEGYKSEGNTEGNKTFANNITLYGATYQEKPLDVIHISIDSVRISPSGDLSVG